MRRRLEFPVQAVVPEPAGVYRLLGLDGRDPGARTAALHEAARTEFLRLAEPRGLWQDAAESELADLVAGEGLNEPDAPLARIHPQARRRALFAATVGPAPGRRVAELFAAGDFATGAVLDAVASAAAERAADEVERDWAAAPDAADPAAAAWRSQRYSPGYCGWHITAQRQLFAMLRPEAIGVCLNASCLMEPLKSVTGVILAGPPAIHAFVAGFPFCRQCRDRSCGARLADTDRPNIPHGG